MTVTSRVACACLAAANVAFTGMAVRNKLDGSGGGASASDVMSSIVALLQERGVTAEASNALHTLVAEQNPPAGSGATGKLNTALGDVNTKIKTKITPKIVKNHQDTQADIDKSISDLVTATNSAVTDKGKADDEDKKWMGCVRGERQALVEFEAADTALSSSRSARQGHCQREMDARKFDWAPTGSGKFDMACSFETKDCDAAVLSFEGLVNGAVGKLVAAEKAKETTYKGLAKKCTDAKDDEATKQNTKDNAKSDWTKNQTACLLIKGTRETAMCAFGAALSTKCEKSAAFQTLDSAIDGKGTVYSVQDRKDEWKTMSMAHCIIDMVIKGTAIDNQAITNCEGGVKYHTDVGTLNRKNSEYEAQMTKEKFTCGEKTMKFHSGKKWVTPAIGALNPKSTDYKQVDFAPNVNLLSGFDFCKPPQAPGKTPQAPGTGKAKV